MKEFLLSRDKLGIILVGLLALILRILGLARYDLWHDEITSLAKVEISNFWYLSANFPPFQPLYNLLLSYWRVLGDAPSVLRFSSVVCAVVSVGLIYLTGTALFNKKAGIICAFLLSISPFAIHYSQELRPSSLLILLVLISTYSYVRLLGKSSFSFWAVNILANVSSVYLVYTSIFIPLIQSLLIIPIAGKKRVKEVLLFQFIQLILLIPWLYFVTKHFIIMLDLTRNYRHFSPFIDSVSFINLFYSLKNFVAGYYASDNVRTLGAVFCGLLALKGTVDLSGQHKKGWYMLPAFLLIPILSLFFFSKFRALYSERYIPFSIVFLYLITGFAISRLDKRLIFMSLLACSFIAALSLSNYYSNNIICDISERLGTNPKKEFKKAAYFLKDNYRQGDLVMHTSESSILPLAYYFDENGKKDFLNKDSLSTYQFMMESLIDDRQNTSLIIHNLNRQEFAFYKDRRFFASQERDKFIDGQRRIWLILSHWESPDQFMFINDWFEKRCLQENFRRFSGIQVYLYSVENRSQAR
ncbi:MAG: glycosyltransferase family 39 protein [Candidatus Omnitrophota bacterium]